jgi:ABC-type antimicrobial peptide transport system ATPase subunit
MSNSMDVQEIYYRFDMKVSDQIIHNMDMDEFKIKFMSMCNSRFENNVQKNVSFIMRNPELCRDYSRMLGLQVETFMEFLIHIAPKVFNKRMIMFIVQNYKLKKEDDNVYCPEL